MSEASNINVKGNPSVNIARKALIIWGTASFFYFFQFILRVSPGSCADHIMTRLSIDASEFGQIIGFYYLGYALLQIPAGMILDRFGARVPGTLAILMCSFGVMIFAMSENIMLITIGRFMMGAGSAFGLLSNIKIASQLFTPRQLPIMIGLTLMTGTAGAIFAGAPLAIFIQSMGSQAALYTLFVIGMLHAILFFSIVNLNKSQRFTSNTSFLEVMKSIKDILIKPHTYTLGLYGMLMYLPLSGFSELWGPSFLEDTRGFSTALATMLTSCTFIGMGIGSPLWSYLHTRLNNYYAEFKTSALLTILFFSIVFYLPINNPFLVGLLLFLGGLSLSGQFLGFSYASEQHDASKTAMAVGTHNMMCMVSGVIAQPLIGFFIELGGRVDIPGKIVYRLESYQMGFATITIGLLLSILCLWISKDIISKHKTI